jgi:hypothetical protein
MLENRVIKDMGKKGQEEESKTFTMEGLKERYLSPRPTWLPRK